MKKYPILLTTLVALLALFAVSIPLTSAAQDDCPTTGTPGHQILHRSRRSTAAFASPTRPNRNVSNVYVDLQPGQVRHQRNLYLALAQRALRTDAIVAVYHPAIINGRVDWIGRSRSPPTGSPLRLS